MANIEHFPQDGVPLPGWHGLHVAMKSGLRRFRLAPVIGHCAPSLYRVCCAKFLACRVVLRFRISLKTEESWWPWKGNVWLWSGFRKAVASKKSKIFPGLIGRLPKTFRLMDSGFYLKKAVKLPMRAMPWRCARWMDLLLCIWGMARPTISLPTANGYFP